VAPTTPNFTLVYLSLDFVPAKAATDEVANGVHFVAAYVVKLKQNRISFATVGAWMLSQILEYTLNYLRFGCAAAACHVGDVVRLIPDVSVSLHNALALFALRT
jgi:hypothetical protein